MLHLWTQGGPIDTLYGKDGSPWEFGGNGLRMRTDRR